MLYQFEYQPCYIKVEKVPVSTGWYRFGLGHRVPVSTGVSIDTGLPVLPRDLLAGTGKGQKPGGRKGKPQDNSPSYCPSFSRESQS